MERRACLLPPHEPTSSPLGTTAVDPSSPVPARVPGVPLDAVARAATRGIQIYPSVASAQFSITGSPRAPELTVTLVFTPALENQRIKDEIRYELIRVVQRHPGARDHRLTEWGGGEPPFDPFLAVTAHGAIPAADRRACPSPAPGP